MVKSKKKRSPRSDSDSNGNNSDNQRDEERQKKGKISKRKVERDSSTSSSSSSSTSSSSDSEPSTSSSSSSESEIAEKPNKMNKKSKQQKTEIETQKSKRNGELSKSEEQRSKWDSPDRARRRRRSHSNSPSPQRRREHERAREREYQLRRERVGRARDRDDRSPRESRRSRSRNRCDSPHRRNRAQRRSRSRSYGRFSAERGGKGHASHPRRNYSDGRRDDEAHEWGKKSDEKKGEATADEPVEKEKPNFGLSGALAEDTNKVNGVVIKYSEPPEARKPKRRWRLYPFKGEQALPTLHIHRQSCFLVGRERKVVDLPVDHPSCSKQHAVFQYRLVSFKREDGTTGKRVRLYIIDLESANGTFLNNKKIEARKYYELLEKDVIKFGFSSREYVLLHENSKEDQEDDDIVIKNEPEAEAQPLD